MATVAQPDRPPAVARRSADARVAAAIDLGWRVAALHGLSPATLAPPNAQIGDMLVNRASFPAADRLDLELRAIAGVAQQAGAPLAAGDVDALKGLIGEAAESADGEERFRLRLAQTHVTLAKDLWANNESHGRAYELGNFLSDTWNRLLRPRATDHPQAELIEIFAAERIKRMKVLLDNLQTKLDPAAVHVVDQHLGSWRDRVATLPAAEPDAAPAPLTRAEVEVAYEPVRRQTIIWRQMLGGDKEPEAYIGHAQRAAVRDELTKQLWRRYRRLWWVVPVAAVVGFAIGYLLVHEKDAAAGLIGTVAAVGGMVGVTRASMIATVKRGLQDWGELMWNRSLAAVICRETLVVDELIPPPPGAARPR